MTINDEPRQWHPALLMCGACLKKLPFVKSLFEMAADQSSRFVGLVVFLLLQLAFFLFGYIRHVGGGGGAPYFGLAKAGGSMLNFNCALILLHRHRQLLLLALERQEALRDLVDDQLLLRLGLCARRHMEPFQAVDLEKQRSVAALLLGQLPLHPA